MPDLKPGEYSVWLSLIDPENQRIINILDGRTDKEPTPVESLSLGTLKVTPNTELGAKDTVMH